MPAISPITLTVGGASEVYNPALNSGNKAQFVDNEPDAVYEARTIRFTIRPAGSGNTGRVVETLGVRPIPVDTTGNCCVDVTNPAANTFTVSTMVRKNSTKAEADELVDMIKALVATTAFHDVVTTSSFY